MPTGPTTRMSDFRVTVKVQSATLVYDRKPLKAALRQAGNEVAGEARRMIRAKVGGGRLYRGPGGLRYRTGGKGGPYRASAAGQAPVSVTGTLARSIKVRPFRNGEGVAIRDTAFYALFLEAGAKGGGRIKGKVGKAKSATPRVLDKRPFLTTALARKQDSIPARLRTAVETGVAFKQVK